MELTSASGPVSSAAERCPGGAWVEVSVFLCDKDGMVVPAAHVSVSAWAEDSCSTCSTDESGNVHFRLSGMEKDVDLRLEAQSEKVQVHVPRGASVSRSIYIGGPFLVWSYQSLRQRPKAVYLRDPVGSDKLYLELLGEPGDWEVELRDVKALTVLDVHDHALADSEREDEDEEDAFSLFGGGSVKHLDGRAAALNLPLHIEVPDRPLVCTACIVGKDNSEVSARLQIPVLRFAQRRSRSTEDGPSFDETVKQVVYCADLEVKCEVDGVSSNAVTCDWTMSGTPHATKATELAHHFVVPDDAGHARECAMVEVDVRLAAFPTQTVRLKKTLLLALPNYHGDLPKITDQYLLETFKWGKDAPVRFDSIADAPELNAIWVEKLGICACDTYLLRACPPPLTPGGPGLAALAAIPFDPNRGGAQRKLLGGVVNTSLHEKRLTEDELRAIVGHEALHLHQHAAARDDAASIWRALDDAKVDCYCLRELQAHVWEMAQPGLSHKLLQVTVDYAADYFVKSHALHGKLADGELKTRVAQLINKAYEDIPSYCEDLKADAPGGGAFGGMVSSIDG